MDAVVEERNQKINHYFGANHIGKYEWNKVCLIEKEQPDTIEKIKRFAQENGVDIRYYNGNSIFDYYTSSCSARINTGWMYYKETEKYFDLLELCFELIEPYYPDVKIVMNHLNEIEFVTRSHYIDTPQLNEQFEKECRYAHRFVKQFPRSLYLQVTKWLSDHKELIDSVDKFPNHDRRISVNVEKCPGIRMDDDEVAEQWAKDKGYSSYVFFAVDTRKDEAVKIKKKLEKDGFDHQMQRVYPGRYRFDVAVATPGN